MTTAPDSTSDEEVSAADWRRYGKAHAVARHLYYNYRAEAKGDNSRGRVRPKKVKQAYDKWIQAEDDESAVRFEIASALNISPLDVYVRFMGLPKEIREEVQT